MIKAIAVGASTGGVAAMREIAAGLPADFPIPVLVTIHIGPHRSYLADILQDSGPLPCKQAEAGEPILGGVIYVAPPDHHLVVEAGRAELVRGPKENWARPAIDPLFRSAALEYGPELVAVVLSGKLNDGTAGLYEVKRRGGATVVQDPSDAQEPSMPRSALRHVDVDYVVPLARLPSLLVALTVERSGGARSKSASPSEASMSETASHWANPTAQTCPECGGAMSRDDIGTLSRYRCHTGHVFTSELLAEAQLAMIDQMLEGVFRSLKERAAICSALAARNGPVTASEAEGWSLAADEATDRAEVIEKLLKSTWIRPDAA